MLVVVKYFHFTVGVGYDTPPVTQERTTGARHVTFVGAQHVTYSWTYSWTYLKTHHSIVKGRTLRRTLGRTQRRTLRRSFVPL